MTSVLEHRKENSAPFGEGQLWHVETLTTLDDIRRCAPQWCDLERDCADPNAAFQSYAWCKAWATVYCGSGAKYRPRIYLIYRGTELVALLPTMLVHHLGITTQTIFAEPHTQIANVLARSGIDCSEGLALCIETALQAGEADFLALGPLVSGSPLARALALSCQTPDPAEHISLVTWPGTGRSEDYLLKLSKNRRKDFGKKLRRLQTKGPVDFEIVEAGTQRFERLARTALEWKRQWLARTGLISAGLEQDWVGEFLTGFKDCPGGYTVEIEALNCAGQPVAITLNLVGKGVRHCYLSAYDHRYSDVSPGTLIHQHSIQASIDDAYAGYSFLGHPTHFKSLWANEAVPLMRYQQACSIRGRLWLGLWVNTTRPLSKRIILMARNSMKIPMVRSLLLRIRTR